MSTQPLIILGTGGSAYDVLDIVDAINADRRTWEVVGFLDDAKPTGGEHSGYPILGKLSDATRFDAHRFVNVIGSDTSYARRPRIVASTGLDAGHFATLVHPGASVSSRVRLGRGTYVNHGVSVGGGTVVGDHVALGPGAIVGHDSILEDFALIAPGAVISGFCRIGLACYVGAAAAIRQRVTVGDGALVGMGAVVLRDVLPGQTVVGNPARVLVRSIGVTAG
jgi:sugar O-acyltransferase (sialic acid O-acetyltransferase NeuD family)